MTSIDIYHADTFKPTFLYIKQHKITGLMYFGKSTKTGKAFHNYLGSGSYWKNHIKKHGEEHVETLWYCLFTDQESLSEFAINFSTQEHIVESTNWANQIPETGIDMFSSDTTFANETKLKMRLAKLGKKNQKVSDANSKRMGDKHPLFGIGQSEQCRAKMSASAFNRYKNEEPYTRTSENREYFKNLRWVNDGTRNRRIPSESILPPGFTYGKINIIV